MEMTDIVQNKDLVRRPEDCRTISELSATEDDKTLQKVVHKLKRLFGRVISAEKAVTSRSAIIETDYDQNKAPENNEQTIPVVNNFGSFDDLFEYRLCQNISKQLEQLLSNYGKKEQKCRLLVPSDLPPRIAQDVLRMSQNEPCGIRGCVLFVNMEGKAVCHRLGKIECDPATVATFELYLTLKEDTRPWVIAKTLLASVKGCLINGNSSSDVKVLHTGFQLAKRKLYRRN